ncbi:MAG: hypothetical protein Q4A85_06580 [Kingella sp. (in: b-proteobacteria)]|nr:hypothetical protein [Kingella sp. (in: b-proteobacteria)]
MPASRSSAGTVSGCSTTIPPAFRQPETFAKPVTNGASVAHQHLGKSVM